MLEFDAGQLNVLKEVSQALSLPDTAPSRKNVISIFPLHSMPVFKNASLQNVYLYGPVGRGKTTLIKQVYDASPLTKQKMHFDQLCSKMHTMLAKMDIETYVKLAFASSRLIWIDELQIYDITTAMLLKRLIPALLKKHHVLILTGNVEPVEFYKGGLNRDQFEGFIPYFYEYFRCIPLNGLIDYRRNGEQGLMVNEEWKGKRFWQLSDTSLLEMETLFSKQSPAEKISSFKLDLDMRFWSLEKTLSRAVMIPFSSLAEENHCAHDYDRMVDMFPNVFLTGVPVFTADNRDACRRFMAFIDILYEKGGRLYMEAAACPDELYQDPAHFLPFERTESRLIEMTRAEIV